MNNNIIEYRPYQQSRYFVPFMAIITICSWIFTGVFFWSGDVKEAVCYGICSIWITFITKSLYDSLRKMIIIEEEGLRIIGDGSAIHTYISWDDLSYGYYHKDYKGNWYFLLSATPLDRKRCKRILHRRSLSLKICVSNVVVVYSSLNKDVSHIKEFFLHKIRSIEEF